MAYITHNIALTFPQDISNAYIDFAENFSDSAYDYCISEHVIPHITLCQIALEDLELHTKIVDALSDIVTKGFDIDPFGIGFRFGSKRHREKLWLELSFKKNDGLVALQKEVCDTVKQLKIKPLTVCDINYHPHLTFCNLRLNDPLPRINSVKSFNNIMSSQSAFLSFGQSDDNGQFLSVDWKKRLG